jgi:ribokinase
MEMRQMAEALGAGRVTVFGSAHEDVVLEVARFPVPGETIVAASSERLFGGKGANQAISAAQAGAPVSFIGVVGSDEGGERVLGNLALHGIDVAGVRRSVELPTGLALILVDGDGDNQIVVAAGAAQIVDEAFVDLALQDLDTRSVLVLQCELPAPAVARAARRAADAGVRVVLNLAPFVELPVDALSASSVIVVNEIEAMALVGDHSEGSPESTAAEISRRTGAETIITLGARGSVAALPSGESIRVAAHPVAAVVDTTGAGDAYVGALAAALAAGHDTGAAMHKASFAAARVVEFRGAQPPLVDQPERVMRA